MNGPLARTRRTRRLGAGIAAAAVVTTGLACLGTANAAELADFPQTLDFTVADLVATDADVYAVGYVGVDTDPNDDNYGFDELDGYVEAVGAGVKITLGDGSWPTAVTASPDGETLTVIGTRKDVVFPQNGSSGYRWTIDTDTMTASEATSLGFGTPLDVASDASGTYIASSLDSEASVQRLGSGAVSLGTDVSPTDIALLPRGEATDVVVVGNDWVEGPDGPEGQRVAQATLRMVQGENVGEKVVLGPDGGADQGITGIDVDEVNGLVYVTTFRDMPDGPQQYGLNVIGADVDEYYPIDYPVSSVAVSADGGTVFLPGTGVSAYDTTRLGSYSEDDPAPAASIGSGWVGNATLDPSGRLYATVDEAQYDAETEEYLGSVTTVHAVEAPLAPTGLTATTSEWDADTLAATWTAPTGGGGVDPETLDYLLSLQDEAGGEPITAKTFATDHEFDRLLPGHTYTLTVSATNGAFTSAPATATYVAPAKLAAPSKVAVAGKVAVGNRVSVATTGSWPAGTVRTYEWRNNAGTVLSRSSTYIVSPTQASRRLRVSVTGTLAGFTSATVTSAYSVQVALGTLVSPTPRITGTAKVGSTLTATPGTWTSGTRLTYRWTANGSTIRGATGRSYKPTRAVAGKRIRVVVTGTKTGYRTVAKTSATTAAVKR